VDAKADKSVLELPSVVDLTNEVRAANPAWSNDEVEGSVKELLKSGATIPEQISMPEGSILAKITPKGEEPSAGSPYWMSLGQAEVLAGMSPSQVARALGLPADQASKMVSGGFDVYEITAPQGANVFESQIAPTLQGTHVTIPALKQEIVPNRSLWTTPKKIDPSKLQ
jgi:hypothetical protein